MDDAHDASNSAPEGDVAIWATVLLGKRGSRRKKITTGAIATFLMAIVAMGVRTYWNDALALVAEARGKELHYVRGRIRENEMGLHLDLKWGVSGMTDSGKSSLAAQFRDMLSETDLVESVSADRFGTEIGLLYKKTRRKPEGLVVLATYDIGSESQRNRSAAPLRIIRYDPDDEHANSFYTEEGFSLPRNVNGSSRIATEHLGEFHLQTARLLGEYERLNHLSLYIEQQRFIVY